MNYFNIIIYFNLIKLNNKHYQHKNFKINFKNMLIDMRNVPIKVKIINKLIKRLF